MLIPASSHGPKCRRRRAVCELASLSAFFALGCAWANAFPAAPAPNAAFFASPGACIASKILSKSECDEAFGAAIREMRSRGLYFASQFECVARFRLCERVDGPAELGATHTFRPVLLGIEIARGPRGRFAEPVFAVETPPEFLPPKPAAGVVPRTREGLGALTSAPKPPQLSPELPIDHFEHVDSWDIKKRWSEFHLDAAGPNSLPADADSRPRETPQQRRERIKNAPYIE